MNIRENFQMACKLEALGKWPIDLSIGSPDIEIPNEFYKYRDLVSLQDKTFFNTILTKDGRPILDEDGDVRITMKNPHGYGNPMGYPETRERVASDVTDMLGIDLTSDDVIMTGGAIQGIHALLSTFFRDGDSVMVMRPFFGPYLDLLKVHSLKPVIIDSTSDFDINLEDVIEKFEDGVKGIILNDPNNPTGKIYSAEIKKELATLLPLDTIYIEDTPYSQLVFEGSFVSMLHYFKNAFHVNSLSKNLAVPGERLGYIAMHPDNKRAGEVAKTIQLLQVNAPINMQKIIRYMGVNHSFAYDLYKHNIDVMSECLDKHGFEFNKPEGAFYIFAKLPEGLALGEFESKMHEGYDPLFAPDGSAFGYDENYIRFALCKDTRVIDRAVSKFDRVLGK